VWSSDDIAVRDMHDVPVVDQRTLAGRFNPGWLSNDEALTSFRASLQESRRGPVEGNFSIRNGGLLEGWAISLDSDQPAKLRVALDDRQIWCGEADRLVTIETQSGELSLPCGFRVTIPHDFTDGARLTVCGPAGEIAAPVFLRISDRYVGNVELVSTIGSEVIVEGWVHDRARDRDSLPVELRADGKIITAAIANTYREDLKQAGRGNAPFA
jgi:hypothetical protein